MNTLQFVAVSLTAITLGWTFHLMSAVFSTQPWLKNPRKMPREYYYFNYISALGASALFMTGLLHPQEVPLLAQFYASANSGFVPGAMSGFLFSITILVAVYCKANFIRAIAVGMTLLLVLPALDPALDWASATAMSAIFGKCLGMLATFSITAKAS